MWQSTVVGPLLSQSWKTLLKKPTYFSLQTRIPKWSAPLGNWEKLGAQQPRIRTQKGRQPYCMNSLRKMHHKLSRSTCFPPPPWLGHECPQSSVHLAGHLPKHVRVVYKCKFLQMAYEWAPAESQPACGIGRKHHQSPTTGKTSRRISAPGLALQNCQKPSSLNSLPRGSKRWGVGTCVEKTQESLGILGQIDWRSYFSPEASEPRLEEVTPSSVQTVKESNKFWSWRMT